MSREELAAYLADLVRRRQLNAGEAAALLSRFDAGDLPADLLPLPETDTTPAASTWLAALVFVLLLVGGNANLRLTTAQRTRARDLLRLRFQADIIQTATLYTSGRLAVAVWQRSMQASITTYSLRMASAGAGTLPSAVVQTRVADMLLTQRVFLRRFAVQLAAQELSGRAMSEAALNARSQMYGESGWSAFWVGQADGVAAGYVERWISLDDNRTCSVCSALNGQVFLPGEGEMPGSSCLGGGNCRCRREPEYNPAEYARLTGQRVAA